MHTPHDLHRDLGRMEGKLDAVLVELRGTLSAHTLQLEDHDGRIQSLEDTRTERRGVMRAVHVAWIAGAGIVGAMMDRLWDLFTYVAVKP